jgi:hypothetical protein
VIKGRFYQKISYLDLFASSNLVGRKIWILDKLNRGRAYVYAFCMKPAGILLPGKQRQGIQARILLCFRAVKEPGLSETSLAQKLGSTRPGVCRAVQRGEKLAIDEQLEFELNTQNA